jgi:hypothetical protein
MMTRAEVRALPESEWPHLARKLALLQKRPRPHFLDQFWKSRRGSTTDLHCLSSQLEQRSCANTGRGATPPKIKTARQRPPVSPAPVRNEFLGAGRIANARVNFHDEEGSARKAQRRIRSCRKHHAVPLGRFVEHICCISARQPPAVTVQRHFGSAWGDMENLRWPLSWFPISGTRNVNRPSKKLPHHLMTQAKHGYSGNWPPPREETALNGMYSCAAGAMGANSLAVLDEPSSTRLRRLLLVIDTLGGNCRTRSSSTSVPYRLMIQCGSFRAAPKPRHPPSFAREDSYVAEYRSAQKRQWEVCSWTRRARNLRWRAALRS